MKIIYLNALNLLQRNMLEATIQQKNFRLNADIESDKRIDRKMIKVRKNSCVMIIGELIFINSEFQIEAIHYFIYKK